jgi:hypothetical protein
MTKTWWIALRCHIRAPLTKEQGEKVALALPMDGYCYEDPDADRVVAEFGVESETTGGACQRAREVFLRAAGGVIEGPFRSIEVEANRFRAG